MQATFAATHVADGENPEKSKLSPSLRFLLREATSDTHSHLDNMMSRMNLQRLDGYRRFLETSANAILPIEAALAAAGVDRIVADWSVRTRTAAITADIACVGGETHPLSFSGDLNTFEMMGTLYVLEGSRLGAKVLLKHVMDSDDDRIRNATSYLRHGVGLKLWPTFVAILDSRSPTSSEEADAIGAARRTFALFTKAAA